jgi:hypothetical protein
MELKVVLRKEGRHTVADVYLDGRLWLQGASEAGVHDAVGQFFTQT